MEFLHISAYDGYKLFRAVLYEFALNFAVEI
jgi:hypothetical protein